MKKIFRFVAILALVFAIIFTYVPDCNLVKATVATGTPGNSNSENTTNESNLLNNLKKYYKNDIKVKAFSIEDGQIFISGVLSDKKKPSFEEALKFLEKNKSILGINKENNNKFKEGKSLIDNIGYTHIRLDQYISGVPVLGKSLTVHFDKNGIITAVTGSITSIKEITKLGDKSITSSDAIKIAKGQFKYINSSSVKDEKKQQTNPKLDDSLKKPTGEKNKINELLSEPTAKKMIIISSETAHEVYSVNIRFMNENDFPENWNVYVDTSSGKVLDMQSRIRDAATQGTGIGVDGNTKQLNLDKNSDGNYYMTDLSKPGLNSLSHNITTVTANNTNGDNLYYYYSKNGNFNTEYGKALVDAHYNAGVVYDFYKNLFNQNSIDSKGMTIDSVAHLGNKYNNAFWDGSAMWYGDGDGTSFTYLSGDLDVVGHEFTHGVTEAHGDLNYHNQSGALNESISDVFGVLIETYNKYNVKSNKTWQFNSADWVVGDDVYTPKVAGDALRSLANPKLYKQPDNMDNYVKASDNQDDDYGRLHTNSGIPNKAAYLIAQSIGMSKTAAIYYRGYNYLNYNIDFKGAALAYIQAAKDLYGENSAEVQAVKTAFITVKVLPVSPKVISTTPTNASTNVAVKDSVVIKFNKPIVAGNNYKNITIKTSSGTSLSVTPTISNDTLTLTHSANFANSTKYIVNIPKEAIKDVVGTVLESQYSFSFTTAAVQKASIEGYVSIYLGEKGSGLNNLLLSKLNQTVINSTFSNLVFKIKKNANDQGVVYSGKDIFMKNSRGNYAEKNGNNIVVGKFKIVPTDLTGKILSISGAGYLNYDVNISMQTGNITTVSTESNSIVLKPGDIGTVATSGLALLPDGKINNIDFSAWLKIYQDCMSKKASADNILKADFTKNNTIDSTDFSLWLASYQKVLGIIPTKTETHTIVKSEGSITPKFVFDKGLCKAGDVVNMSVKLTGVQPNTKTNSVMFTVQYDDKAFELLDSNSIKDGRIKFTSKLDSKTESGREIQVMYVDMNGDTLINEGDTVFNVSFKVKNGTSAGNKKFVLSPVDMLDSSFNTYNINNGQKLEKSINVVGLGTTTVGN